MAEWVKQRRYGTPLSKNHVSDDGGIADRDPPEMFKVMRETHVVEAQQKTVFHGMIIDEVRQLTASFGGDAAAMQPDSARHIESVPSAESASPCEIRVFPVGEKIFIEILAVDRRIVQRLAAI